MFRLAIAAVVLAAGLGVSAQAAEFYGGFSSGGSYRGRHHHHHHHRDTVRYVPRYVAPRYVYVPVEYYVEPRYYRSYNAYGRGYDSYYGRDRYHCR